MTQTTKPNAPLAIGERIAYSPRGEGTGLVITLQRLENIGAQRVYAVTTMAGPHRLDDWSKSYPTETEARSAARHVALAFREWGCEAAISARRNALRFRVRDILNSRRRSPKLLDELELAEAELDALMTLGDRETYLSAVADARETGG